MVQFQMEIVLAELEYGDTGFSPTPIARVKKEFKKELNEIEGKFKKSIFVGLKCKEMDDRGKMMNKSFTRISLTLITYKNRKAAYPSARVPVPTKINSPICRLFSVVHKHRMQEYSKCCVYQMNIVF